MTFAAGPRPTGLTAPWVMDGDAFRAYVHHVLAPILKRGDVMVLDNLPAHKVVGVHEDHYERRMHVFYLPPNSPDMNPIEMAFSKLKALFRREPARTTDHLVGRIGQLHDRFQPTVCANFFEAAGYQRPS